MRLGPTSLLLLCSLICVSNAVPPRQIGYKASFGTHYSEAEDQLIVDELQNFLEHTIKPQSRSVWNKVAEKHYEKWEQGTPGFRHERSANSLRNRFILNLAYNKGHRAVNVPGALIQNFKTKATRQPYTMEEDNFIIEELSKPSYTNVFGPSTLQALSTEHAKKREAGIPGFEKVRSAASFRNHLFAMKNAGQFTKEVLEKYNTHEKCAASSSQITTSNPQTGLPVTEEGRGEEDWQELKRMLLVFSMIADMIEELQNTDYEIDFSKLQ